MLKEPRVGKFKRTKSISLSLSCGFYGATSNLCTKVNHRSLLMRVEDIHHQGVICRTGPGAVERIFPAFATPAASFAIPQIAATYLPPRRAKVLRSCTKHFWGLGKEKQKERASVSRV
jgi:hypothetical protein